MRTLHTSSSGWLALLPTTLSPLKRTVENIKDPLYRFFEREVNFGVKLLQSVRQDLEDVVAITMSGKKQTNHHRALIAMLTKGMIPSSRVRYKVPTSCSVAAWVTDFSSRVKQLSDVSRAVGGGGASQLKSITLWMGGKKDLTSLFCVMVTYLQDCSTQRFSSQPPASVWPRLAPGHWKNFTWMSVSRMRQTNLVLMIVVLV